MYVCIYIYIYTHIHLYIYIYTHTHTYRYIYVYICVNTCIYVEREMCVYIYIYTHTHMYIYIYIAAVRRAPAPAAAAARAALPPPPARGAAMIQGASSLSEVHKEGHMTTGHSVEHRNSLQQSLCPVVIRPYLCSSDTCAALKGFFTDSSGLLPMCIYIYIYIYNTPGSRGRVSSRAMYTYIHMTCAQPCASASDRPPSLGGTRVVWCGVVWCGVV